MRTMRLLLCALALVASTAAQAVWLTPDGQWSISVIEPQQGNYPWYPATPTFNGRRTVNASGLSMYDVAVPNFGLIEPHITRIAINDAGWVLGHVWGWNPPYEDNNTDHAFLTNGTDSFLIPGSYRMQPQALGNSGAALLGQTSGGSFVYGVAKPPPSSFFEPGAGWYSIAYYDTNDAGQYLVSLFLFIDEPNNDGALISAMAVLAPVPEPLAYVAALAGIAVLVGLRRRLS